MSGSDHHHAASGIGPSQVFKFNLSLPTLNVESYYVSLYFRDAFEAWYRDVQDQIMFSTITASPRIYTWTTEPHPRSPHMKQLLEEYFLTNCNGSALCKVFQELESSYYYDYTYLLLLSRRMIMLDAMIAISSC